MMVNNNVTRGGRLAYHGSSFGVDRIDHAFFLTAKSDASGGTRGARDATSTAARVRFHEGSRAERGDDEPLVTPPAQTRGSVSTALLAGKLPAPPLAGAKRARNPLDLLSAVSARIANEEGRTKRQRTGRTPAGRRVEFAESPRPVSGGGGGSKYVGERNSLGQRHGRGFMVYPNGCRYDGRFANDRRHGFGECRYPNGCVYVGFWHDGRRHGVGRMTYPDRGEVHEGGWARDERHGPGICHRPDGRADVCVYRRHRAAGEGVQWSPNREFAVRLVDGINRGPVSVGDALDICAGMGVAGPPRPALFRAPALFQ